MNTKEICPVYLRSGDRGLYTYINRKIYFIDREYATILNKEGIAFVFVTKEKDKYGFLGGSYEANNWDNGDYKEYLTPNWVERLEDVYIYNGCIFYFIRDNLSDGCISVYYYNSDIKGLMCITGRSISGRGAYSGNMHIRDCIIQNSKRVSEDIYIDIADTLFKDEKSKTSLFKILISHFYTCPLSVSISEDRVLKIVEKGYFENNRISYGVILNGRYCGITGYFTSNLVQKLNFTEDISDEFKNWCNSIYITKNMNAYSEDGLRVVTSEFLGAKKKVVLVDKYSENVDSTYLKHKEEIERSVKEYKDWVSSLRKYVTVKNAKQYREIQLDKLLWTGDL